MLPFLKNKKDAAVYVAPTTQHIGEPSPEIKLARNLIKAIEDKDEKGVLEAFKACFQHCESQPHEEYSEEIDQE